MLSTELTTAVNLANNINELAIRTPYNDLRTVVGTGTGRTYSPPIDGMGADMTELNGQWVQVVTVKYVSPTNLTFTVPDTLAGSTTKLQGGAANDTFATATDFGPIVHIVEPSLTLLPDDADVVAAIVTFDVGTAAVFSRRTLVLDTGEGRNRFAGAGRPSGLTHARRRWQGAFAVSEARRRRGA